MVIPQRIKLNWQLGRQGTGYKKLKLFELGNKLLGGVDLYLLQYNKGSFIPPHVDTVEGKRHYRLNFTLKEAIQGGELFVIYPIFKLGRLTLFRSDVSLHAVHEVEQGTRWVLSLGVAF